MAGNAFLKIKEIPGESIDTKHEKEWEVSSYQLGASMPVSIGNSGLAGAGKASVSELVVTKTVDKATPKIWAAATMGTHFPEVVLSLSKMGNKEQPFDFYKVTLTDAMISSVSKSGSGHDASVHESVSIAFSALATEYFAQKQDGTSEKVGNMSYDLKKNAK